MSYVETRAMAESTGERQEPYFQSDFLGVLEGELSRAHALRKQLHLTIFDTTNFPAAQIDSLLPSQDAVGDLGGRLYGVIFPDVKETVVLHMSQQIIDTAGNGIFGIAKRKVGKVMDTPNSLFQRALMALEEARVTNTPVVIR